MNETGDLYRNGTQVGQRFYLGGYYPTHFATDGTDFWFSIADGKGDGGYWVYKNREKASEETWVVRDLANVGGHLEIFSGMSLFRDWQRVERFEPDKAQMTTHRDNVMDFHFVLP